MTGKLRATITREHWYNREALIVIRDMRCPDGVIRPHIGKIVWEQREEGFFLAPDDVTLGGQMGEVSGAFLDALHRIGSAEDATAGKLQATERHLEDMRALVFKTGKP